MPKIAADRLEEIGRALFVAAGTPEDEAALVMRHIVGANLVGHDSHGVIQIPTYIDRIKAGHIVPGAPWVIVKESPTTTVVDGNWGFGYVANERAMRLTIEKAEKSNVAAATVFRQGHIGRLSSYTQMAARAGMIGLITADFGPLAESRRAIRRARGAARHEPDLDGDPVRSRRAALSRHGDLGRRRRQDRARGRAQREGAGWLGHRRRRHARPTIRASCARAARCCRWAARTAATRAPVSRSWSRSCAAC